MLIAADNPIYTPHFFYQLADKKIDLSADTIKAILMDDQFFFIPTDHATKADVNANQIASANGYTQDDKTLSGGTLTEDDTNFRVYRTFSSFSWQASGGAIPAIGTLVLYDDTTSDDTIICAVDVGLSALQTAVFVDASNFTIAGDQSSWIEVGMRTRLVQTSDDSAEITVVAYSSPNTTVTVTGATVDSGLSGAYLGTVYNTSTGDFLSVQPITLVIGQTLSS